MEHFASIVDSKVLKHHHLASPDVAIDKPHPQVEEQQQEDISNIQRATLANAVGRLKPNLPRRDLFIERLSRQRLKGNRERYLEIGIPLYEASIRCNWKDAKAILDTKPYLVRYSITESGETALHVSASAKGEPGVVEGFVQQLVDLMTKEDLMLENENFNTALYLAAAAGNVEVVKIMVRKNGILPTIAGSAGQIMPLYAAAMFGNNDVVKYLYEISKDLHDDDGWTDQNRGQLLEKCIANDMFDVALKIVKSYPELCNGSALRALARKPEAFSGTKSNTLGSTIKSALGSIGLNVAAAEHESSALILLRFIWEHIAKKPRDEINSILRGPPDLVEQDNKRDSEWTIQAMQLQKLISYHVTKMTAETEHIMARRTNLANQDISQAMKLQNLISDCLVNIHDEVQKIIKGTSDLINQDNKPVSSKGDLAKKLECLIFEYIAHMHEKSQDIIKVNKGEDQAEKSQDIIKVNKGEDQAKKSLIKVNKGEDQALKLKNLILVQTKKMGEETNLISRETRANEKHSSRVHFIAAEMGNTNFLVELIRKYPDLIWKVNDDKETIFHVAVKHRHEDIFNLLFQIGAMKEQITPRKDENGNNMLHLVAKLAKQKRLNDVSGVALQMQRELLWFQEIKNMIPPSYREAVNKDGLTPHELFTMEHKELVSRGEEWMKGTTSQCMVVAALIATIVFAAAFAVPGGYAESNGNPIFRSKATFMVFVVTDAISLFLSCASMLIFLSILTSRYAESDFLESLPKKLISGLLTLFLSIATMVVSFGISFFVLYHKGLLWAPILICVFAVVPVVLYMWLQFGLFYDVFRYTYRSRHLFRPTKHVLYYKNPTV